MNLNSVKDYIMSQVGISHVFLYLGCRNQNEEFFGYIDVCYPYIFTIKLNDNCIKTFSYNDFIIGNLKIKS